MSQQLHVVEDRNSRRQPAERPRVAIVLNGNARAVDDRLVATLQKLARDETVYVSHSPEQSRFIARSIVHRGFDIVVCGGGDGTVTRVISDVAAQRPRRMPAFSVLRLGTGNAMADALGAARGTRGMNRDLARIREGERSEMRLLRVEKQLTPFCGVGIDAKILEDYQSLRRSFAATPLRGLYEGPLGYGMAIATRTLWHYALRDAMPHVVIRNEGATAYALDLEGRAIGRPLPRGEVLYRGPVMLAAASTIPFYGFGCRMFPQVDRRADRFQLRVGCPSPAEVLGKLPAVLNGRFQSSRLWDFACTAVSIACEGGAAAQLGGDLLGRRRYLHIGMQAVDVVRGSRSARRVRDEAPRRTLPDVARLLRVV